LALGVQARQRPLPARSDITLNPLGTLGGPARAVAVEDGMAYVGVGRSVVVADVARAAAPVVVGQTAALADDVVGIAVAGRYAYAAARFAGLYVLDVGDPADPRVLARVDTPGVASDVAVAAVDGRPVIGARHVFLADGADGLRVIDVADPTAPREVAAAGTPGFAQAVAVEGALAAVAALDGGLRLFDVGRPEDPRPDRAITQVHGAPLEVWDVALAGGGAYMATRRHGLCRAPLSGAAPSDVLCRVSGIDGVRDAAVAVAAGARHVFALHTASGLVAGDLVAGERPPPAGSPNAGSWRSWNGGLERPVALAAAGDVAYVVDEAAGLRLVDASEPGTLLEVGYVGTRGDVQAVAASGGRAYAAAGTGGLWVLGPHQDGDVRLRGAHDPADAIDSLRLAGRRAYAGGDGLHILDLADPDGPRRLGRHPGTVRDVAPADEVVFTVGPDRGLEAVDVRDPTAPRHLAALDLPGWPLRLALARGHAYVACGDAGLAVVDVSDPAAPRHTGTVRLPGWAFGVTVAGPYAYVASIEAGIHILDLDDPSAPRPVAHLDTPGQARAVAVVGDDAPGGEGTPGGRIALVADGAAGIRIVDVADPARPRLLGGRDADEDVLAIAVDGGMGGGGTLGGATVYAALGDAGVQAFRLDVPDPARLTPLPGTATASRTPAATATVADPPTSTPTGNIPGPATSTPAASGSPMPEDTPSATAPEPTAPPVEGPFRVFLPFTERPATRATAFRPLVVGQIGGPAMAMDVEGDFAYLGVGRRLDVYDVSAPSAPRLVGTSGLLAEEVWNVEVADGAAYLLARSSGIAPLRSTMYVVDLARPELPRVSGKLAGLPLGPGAGMAARDRVVYLLTDAGFVVVDARDPRRPLRRADVPFAGLPCMSATTSRSWVSDIDIVGGRLYVAYSVVGGLDQGGYVLSFDLPEPLQPRFVACAVAYNRDFMSVPAALVAGDNLAYLLGYGWVNAFDFRDPLTARSAGRSDLSETANVIDATLDGARLYILHERGGLSDTAIMLSLYDVSNPARPRELGRAEIGLRHPRDAVGHGRLVVRGGFAFALSGDGGHLFAADVTSAARPRPIAMVPMMTQVRDLAIDGGRAVLVADPPFGFRSLRLFDLTDPSRPVEVAAFYGKDGQFSGEEIAVSGDYAYAVDQKLWAVDVASPAWPERAASVDLGGASGTRRVAGAGDTVYVSTWNDDAQRADLNIYQVKAPFRLAHRSGHWLPVFAVPAALAVAGNHVFLLTTTGELHVIEAMPPASARVTGSLRLGSTGKDLVRAGGVLVASSDRGLHVVDAADPARPREVGFWPSPTRIAALAAADGYALAGLDPGRDGYPRPVLHVIDLADPSHPRPVRRLAYPDLPHQPPIGAMGIGGPFAYLSFGEELGQVGSGLFVLSQREHVR